MDKSILDMCCGSRMFWFDRADPRAVFVDIRAESHTLCDGRKLEIAPDLIADFRQLPFADNTFQIVVFDPPHLTHCGPEGWQGKKYGILISHGKMTLPKALLRRSAYYVPGGLSFLSGMKCISLPATLLNCRRYRQYLDIHRVSEQIQTGCAFKNQVKI
ncbi:Uncharacterised protein [Yersinia kristensenii]|nr:Methyltransferase [Yersinia kristensenii ATCC 33638]SUP67210.1 Uncharacterised protein [Yersinia kristensenii]